MVFTRVGCQRKVGWCYGPADRNFVYNDGCAEVQNILEEERHKLFSCFESGRLEHSDEFTVLDWETANGEERFILFMCAMAARENMGRSDGLISSHPTPVLSHLRTDPRT